MELDREKIYQLMNMYCQGNFNKFGREIGVDPAHMHRFIKTGEGGGKKIIFGIIKFCNKKRLNINDYIH